MRAPGSGTWGSVGVAWGLATAGAAGLGAPAGVWIGCLVLACVFFAFAGFLHRRGAVHEGQTRSARSSLDELTNRGLLKRALGEAYQRGLLWGQGGNEENFGKWERRTAELIEDALGEAEAGLFLTNEESYEKRPESTPFDVRADSRILRLSNLMMRVDSLRPLDLRPDFDGRDWVSER